MNVRAKALKMVARKGLTDNIGSVVAVARLIKQKQAQVASGKFLERSDAAEIMSAFTGLQGIANQIVQKGESIGDSDAKNYYGPAWLRSIREAREACVFMMKDRRLGLADDKALSWQNTMLNNLLGKCGYLVEDLKRYDGNYLNRTRKPKKKTP